MHGPGHVFVVHGSLTDLVCDLALIPTAWDMYVEDYWERYCPEQPGGPTEAEVAESRVALERGDRVGALVPAQPTRPAFRYVDVGRNRGKPLEGDRKTQELRWLDESVRTALAHVRDDVAAGRLAGARERPLVAVPAFGPGEGGFKDVRGEVARTLQSGARRPRATAGPTSSSCASTARTSPSSRASGRT